VQSMGHNTTSYQKEAFPSTQVFNQSVLNTPAIGAISYSAKDLAQ